VKKMREMRRMREMREMRKISNSPLSILASSTLILLISLMPTLH